MVVVLEGGSVIDMPWLDQVPAVVMAWYPGMAGGTALGELLFGAANFSGKLPITWPKRWDDEPQFTGGTTTQMDYDLGYRWFDRKAIEPLYPFGFGLSYTTFEYANLQSNCSDVTKNGVVEISVDVSNAGSVAGDEIVFVFASYPMTQARRPIKELKGFYRVSLDAGQRKRIKIPLRVADLKYWDMSSNSWQVESGPVQIQVGPNAATLPLTDTFTVQ
jgi:beta-glucosidase